MEILELNDPEKVARLLERYIQSAHLNFLFGSGASMPAIDLAGTVEQEIDQHLAASEHDEANKKALTFIEELEYQHGFLPAGYTEGDDTEITLQNYLHFLSSIDRILFERKNILLPRQANVFTTNYDEFFEVAASLIPSLVLNDGFNRRIGNSGFEYAPELFFDRVYRSGTVYQHQSEIPSVNLVKVHGSISWKRQDDEKITLGEQETVQLTGVQKDNPQDVRDALAKRAVILPNMRKFESTLLDRVYFDLLRLYSNAMEMENALLFAFGFSFADEHILDITRRAMRNPTAKVVIFAYSQNGAADFEKKFSAHRNVLIIKPEEGQHIGFPELNSLFDTIGVTPEEIHD
ncbi:SIR2 family protein [Sulfitobacter pseudonitzschiae]|uniref:SIR2 family protein n=1 Tax=Pseudosulfitobacter pseudonitzschiae TaxID=1402135 RepID=A0A9Q2RYY2_9RHOB|nr:SIR2 family protein [Pseudosulfitobacter pseudonitzschiae]MBM2294117.1 SIR2 family protein [Pseudosulfitobacter pseudonitzschiae]MBM2299041.1 SIR2 family protein [Pseudosulfitobacter pseudonitzschiae]MBM2303949.1 SIR2 family protein [Pseudosulfitobacter pseudonitzschiae]MBM2313730.1 SIR2 family protein [Pseudosulfitobacter pseudonitzschiae]MBM2318645.1 SIR2 family protein [Pseudosulfitobacter pseudonitzschiae]